MLFESKKRTNFGAFDSIYGSRSESIYPISGQLSSGKQFECFSYSNFIKLRDINHERIIIIMNF